MKTFTRTALISLALILLAYPALAQQERGDAKVFDSYGALGGCDSSARLEFFAAELRKDPLSTGYVIGYGPEGDGSGTGNYLLKVTRAYLVSGVGVAADRIQFVYAGRYDPPGKIFTELYVVPRGTPAPVAKRYDPKLRAFHGKYAEYSGWEGRPDGPGGPEFGNVSFAFFADLMRQQADSVAYIVAYRFSDSTPGVWRRIASRDVDDLTAYGIDGNRFNVIFGGTVSGSAEDEGRQAKLELWLLPKEAAPPVKPVAVESSPQKAVLLGSHYEFEFKDAAFERQTVKGFEDFLLADPRMNACLVLHSSLGGDDPDSVFANEPKVDLWALVQRWKAELLSKHGIAENRITVMVAPSENTGGSVDVWVLPVDAPLPNPFPAEPADDPLDASEVDDQ